jgi:parallel beta-helix repeat protein
LDRKAISIIIVFTLLSLNMLTLTFDTQPVRAEPRTWTVNDDGPADFQTIQEAIDASSNGDTILVSEGVYAEWDIEIYKSLTILANGTVTVDGFQRFYVFKVTANNVTISGFIVTNSSFCGISVSSNYNLIKNNEVVRNTQSGIILFDSHHNVIGNNSLSQNHGGIELGHSLYNVVKENSIALNHGGMLLAYSDENLIESNIIEYNRPYSGIWLESRSSNNIIARNMLSGNENTIALTHAGRNFIYHNNFISSGNQVYMWEQEDSCVWDDGYPSGGNYWSDYEQKHPNAKEIDDSGIWDTPYVIDENNQDNYPLMKPWSLKPSSPLEATQELIETIESWNLTKGTGNSLKAKLKVAIHMLDLGKEDGGIRKLTAFINRVEMLREKTLTNEQADELVLEAQRIIDLING